MADEMVSKCQEAQPSSPAEDEATKQLVQQEVDFRWPVELPRRVRVHRQLCPTTSSQTRHILNMAKIALGIGTKQKYLEAGQYPRQPFPAAWARWRGTQTFVQKPKRDRTEQTYGRPLILEDAPGFQRRRHWQREPI